MEKKVKMRSGGILIVVAIVQVLGNLFAFDANSTWKSCLPDSRLRHRGTGKWKARLLYLARFIAVLFACGVSTSVIPNWYHIQNCAEACSSSSSTLPSIGPCCHEFHPSICRTMATCTTERLPTWYSSTQVSDVSLEYGHRIRASSFEVKKSLCEGDINICPSWGISLLYSR